MRRAVVGPLATGPGAWDAMRARHRWEIPDRFNLARGCVADWAEATPDAPAVIDLRGGRRVWTYLEVERAAARLAGWLAERGVGRGDRVALLMPQRAEVIVAHAAVHRLGAVSLPLFALFGPEALDYRLRDAGAVAVIGEAAGLAKLQGLDLPELRVTVDVDAGLPEGAPVGIADTAAEDPAMMIYTSGTTGEPKGVLHAHRFLWGHLPCIETAYDGFPKAGDVGWTPADWAWIGGLMDLALPCLFRGVPVVAHRFAKFEAGAAWDLMRAERVTCAFVPPAALRAMRRVAVPEGLALRAVISGGEALGADLLHWARDALEVPLNEIYGQTEANLVLAACEGMQDRAPGTLGRAVPGVEVEVMGPDGPVADGEVGEIAVRGSPAAFLRYWNKPEATAAKWRDGWLRTGDLGERLGGPEGSPAIRYHARDDDVINSSGYRIGPTEIETCLCAHPAVHAAAVVGLPDERRGEAVTAFVVADPVEEAELIDWVRARLSPHMAPRAVHFREALPVTATGKVMRRTLRN